ncbi:MAG: glycoside hydrolase family 3 N-terminal domain-containing protein [Tabrizicola sp.]|uniref:glycoside hydrolase family 3 N-terminal domain-containing protein n=1 Tax=Tabrizicola sp. TaxID=2005166 RepID=UPI002734BBBA|nr:glycoside hydrolase family 3 N-terminal domain-containing protein [Tabrizicola sp.]MDP3263389.1 glycoside hydrolase family 3 N-terminal domain-containing protein [Tabrizicola sp.]MDP3646746.1 glycoside hydrolase family 3 N-terminal domain-containing protein [Paracoccaceae bacterium]MDZ4066268.1 glycoside hydrolase family 3 N-terminal domain-containing protein [Tabrizicola sp.]
MSAAPGAAILGCAGLALTADEVAFFREADPFGFILFARNIEAPDQVRRLTAALREAVGRDAPVLIDQEGGRVQRMRAPHWREWAPPLETVRAAGSVAEAARVMRLRSRVIAAELRAVGIDANCAPVADVASDVTHPFLRNRCYGTEAAVVTQVARAVAEGFLAGGVIPVVKHLPGHGRSHVDTHLDLPTVTASREELQAVDFAPFRALNDLPMAMTAHLVFSAYDGERPATQSPVMIDVIRREIGFDGLLMTDDLNMEALKGTLAERTARSIAAGVDVALQCNGHLDEMQAVAGAAGRMGPEAWRRGQAALAWRRDVVADVPALMAELADG